MDERAADFAARHFRWNAGLLLLDSSTFFLGLSFFDSTTVLPVLLARLDAPDWVVGVAGLVQTLGFTLPALAAAHAIHGRTRHKPFLLTMTSVGRGGLLTVPPMLLFFGARRPALALAWFLVLYAVFWLTDGSCAVSWFDILAKAIPGRVRGRFFGTMQTLNGLAAVGAGYVVSRVLRPGGLPFPQNFALLAAFWCVGVAVSQGALIAVREPHGKADDEEKPSFGVYLKRAIPLLRENVALRRLIVTRVLLDSLYIAAPFYVLFAQRNLGAPLRMIGIYAILQSLGKVSMGPAWGWLSDHRSPQAGLRAIALAVAVMPILAIGAAHGAPWLVWVVFFLLGGVADGIWMVASNALMEAVAPVQRPLAVGVASLFQTPGSLFGLFGGMLAGAASYQAVFVCALALGTLAVLSSLRLNREARMRDDG